MRRSIWFGPIALLTLLPNCSKESRANGPEAKSSFTVSMPCSLIWCDHYFDGGSSGGALLEKNGDTLKFAWNPLHGPAKVHVGASYFSEPGAVALEMGSSEESLLIDAMWSAARRESSFLMLARKDVPILAPKGSPSRMVHGHPMRVTPEWQAQNRRREAWSLVGVAKGLELQRSRAR